MNTTSVDAYLEDGCGRCDLYRTPRCKVHRFPAELRGLRAMALDAGLTEEMKWGSPCYTLDGKNVAMVVAFVSHCAVSFFEGPVLDDPDGVLERPGPNSHIGRVVKISSLEELDARRDAIAALLQRAMEATRAGVEVPRPTEREPMPDELQARLDADPALATAFDDLTPGRQRSHILYVSGAKRSQTRATRAERCEPKILSGRGFNER